MRGGAGGGAVDLVQNLAAVHQAGEHVVLGAVLQFALDLDEVVDDTQGGDEPVRGAIGIEEGTRVGLHPVGDSAGDDDPQTGDVAAAGGQVGERLGEHLDVVRVDDVNGGKALPPFRRHAVDRLDRR